ncbi:MAG: protein translocase SEC61 complex subunit gamma [Methanotrichaceae archaeon]
MASQNQNKKSKKSKNDLADKLGLGDINVNTPSFNLQEYLRVLRLARKPTREEFLMISKISILGIALIGMLGFIIYILITVLPNAIA